MYSSARYILRSGPLNIALFGEQPSLLKHGEHAIKLAEKFGANPQRVCFIDAPSGKGGRGHKLIQNPDYTKPIGADGTILLERSSAAIVQTADCPTLVLRDSKTGNVVITHAGRPALSPPEECAACSFSVVDSAFNRLIDDKKRAAHVKAFIVGSICGHCFVHDEPGAESFIQPFDRFGEDVFADRSKGALDLVKVITLQLRAHGVLPEHIHHDGLCTMEDERLSSRRGGRYTKKNTVIVVRQ